MMNNEILVKAENIVNNEVLTCQTSLVEMLLSNGMVNYEDIANYYKDNSSDIEEKQEELDELNSSDRYNELSDKEMEDTLTEEEKKEYDELVSEIDKLEDEIRELENEQEEPQEVYEWWVVSNWLASQLEAHGEAILESEYETWWGRTCTGQAIKMDYVIQEIAK